MSSLVFIGDEVSAAGFRLAGLDIRTPEAAEMREVFDEVRAEADLVIITAEWAEFLPKDRLDEALRALHPLTVVVPDMRDGTQPADIEKELRAVLGLDT